MRNFKLYAEQDSNDENSTKQKILSNNKENSFKKVLRECKEVILDLQREKDNLEDEVNQKNMVIDKLVE